MTDGANAAPLLRIAAATKRFGAFTAVDGLSLDIRAGEFFALLGPSGCGKTTLLRMLAGFEAPDDGEIFLDGRSITSVLPHHRPVNMMFQNYALFPHLSVWENIAFGLKRLGLPKPDIDARVAEMLTLVRLQGFETRKPDQLSGGQRQRVALARSLARRPQILLLDEPLAALDKQLRASTQAELLDLQRRLGTTFIIVTHDQEEAMTVADRIGVMDKGRLVQVASPRELYEMPNSRWVAEFVGDINVLEGHILSQTAGRLTIATRDAGAIVGAASSRVSHFDASHDAAGAKICVAIRPEKIRFEAVESAVEGAIENRLSGTVLDANYLGGVSVYRVRLESGFVLRISAANVSRQSGEAMVPGARVMMSLPPENCIVLEH
jgi:putrescine transport system ATP-binding protein